MKMKEESDKVGLKLNIQKTKIMAWSPITSLKIDGETVETVADFVFLGSKITADSNYSHKIKRCLLLGRKVMTNLDSILKSRDITLSTKVHLVKAMVFPVVMYGCESWTIKKTECWRINAFELWCWRRLLRVHWTSRRSNQYILKEISPGCSLEGLMLKLKLQYFGPLTRGADSLEKTLTLGKIEGRRRRGWGWDGWVASLTQWTWVWVNSGSWWWTGRPGVLQFTGSQRVGHNWVTELNWTESMGLSNDLTPYHPLLLWPSVFPSIRVFSSESALCIRWPKYWSFNFSISPSNEYSELISFRIDWFHLLAVQGTLQVFPSVS